MDMTTTFCKLVVGAGFEFRGRRFVKMNAEIGRDEERGGNVFHASTEVFAEVPFCSAQRSRKLVAPSPAASARTERKQVCGGKAYQATLEALQKLCPPIGLPEYGNGEVYGG
jgi:hypothetical protein